MQYLMHKLLYQTIYLFLFIANFSRICPPYLTPCLVALLIHFLQQQKIKVAASNTHSYERLKSNHLLKLFLTSFDLKVDNNQDLRYFGHTLHCLQFPGQKFSSFIFLKSDCLSVLLSFLSILFSMKEYNIDSPLTHSMNSDSCLHATKCSIIPGLLLWDT